MNERRSEMMRSLHQALLFAQEEIRSLLYTQK